MTPEMNFYARLMKEPNTTPLPPPTSFQKDTATIIAMAIRTSMEEFHGKYLTDAQMAELNPIIRNAVLTAVHAWDHSDENPAKRFLAFMAMMIPPYWEAPELETGYLEMWPTS